MPRDAQLGKRTSNLLQRLPHHWLVTASSWASRIVSALTQIVSVRILLDGLGADQYAIFVLLASFLPWYTQLDFGVGASTQNFISEDRANAGSGQAHLASGLALAAALLLITNLLLYALAPWLSVIALQAFPQTSLADKAQLFWLSGLLSIGVSIGGVAYKVWYAQHKGYLANLMPAIASLFGLLLVWLVLHSHIGEHQRLLACVVGFSLPGCLLALGSAVYHALQLPRQVLAEAWSLAPQILQRASRFWVLSTLAALVLSVDFIIISQTLPPHELVVYSIGTKVFAFSAFFYTSLYAALWPHFTEAVTRNDWTLVKRQLRQAIAFSAVLIISCTLALMAFMPQIAHLLSPRETLTIPLGFVALLGCYHLILAWVHGFATLLQSMSDMRALVLYTASQAVVSVICQIALVHWLGLYGITLGLILSFVLTAAWLAPMRVRHHFTVAGM